MGGNKLPRHTGAQRLIGAHQFPDECRTLNQPKHQRLFRLRCSVHLESGYIHHPALFRDKALHYSTMNKDKDGRYSAEETRQRFEAALRGAREVGHKPQSEMKVGKLKAKTRQSPRRRKPVRG
jgi:hypothetical protein